MLSLRLITEIETQRFSNGNTSFITPISSCFFIRLLVLALRVFLIIGYLKINTNNQNIHDRELTKKKLLFFKQWMIFKYNRNSFERLIVASCGVSIRRNIVIYHFQKRSGIKPIRYKNHAEKYRLKWKHPPLSDMIFKTQRFVSSNGNGV